MDDTMIRTRRSADLDACVAGLRAVHEADAYPMNWPVDPAGWLTPPGLLAAWVAEGPAGTVAGHVLLRGTGEVSRLFVTPPARRRSVASGLLRAAQDWAAGRGLALTLEVADQQRSSAVAFYQALGWRHTGTTPDGMTGPAGEPVALRHYAWER